MIEEKGKYHKHKITVLIIFKVRSTNIRIQREIILDIIKKKLPGGLVMMKEKTKGES